MGYQSPFFKDCQVYRGNMPNLPPLKPQDPSLKKPPPSANRRRATFGRLGGGLPEFSEWALQCYLSAFYGPFKLLEYSDI